MSLCQNVHRRGGIYWWRRHGAASAGRKRPYIQLSLGVRDPENARRLSRLVSVEADRIAGLVKAGMLNSDEQRDLLKRFIGEQIAHLDRVAIEATSKPLVDEEGRRLDAISEHEQAERRLSAVFDILAIGGAEARVQERERAQLAREGFSKKDIFEIESLVSEFAPGYPKFGEGIGTPIGPDYEYFAGVLAEMGIAAAPDAIEHARRLWMRAQSVVLAKTDRRYGLRPAHVAELYAAVMDAESQRARGAASPPFQPIVVPTLPAATLPSTGRASFTSASLIEIAPRPDEGETPPSIIALITEMVENQVNAAGWSKRKVGDKAVSKTANQHLSIARFLVKVAGSDDPRKLKPLHMTELRNLLGKVPPNFGKSPKDWERPFSEIIATAEAKKEAADKKRKQEEMDRKAAILAGKAEPEAPNRALKPSAAVSGRKAATINRWMTQLGTILAYLRTSGYDVPDPDSLKTLRVIDNEPENKKRFALTESDCAAIFAQPPWRGCKSALDRSLPGSVIIHDALYWIPILSCELITRLSEICSAEVYDVDANPDAPAINIWMNGVRDTKNEHSARRIPLSGRIIRLGFLDYVAALKARGEILLFPELQRRAPNTALENTFEKVWAPILDAAIPNRKDEKKSLHSLRHRGNNWLIKRKVLDVIRYAIMGQAGKTVNEKVYTEPFPDETLLEALANLPDVTAGLTKSPLRLSPLLDERV